jgi:hypothetical protein
MNETVTREDVARAIAQPRILPHTLHIIETIGNPTLATGGVGHLMAYLSEHCVTLPDLLHADIDWIFNYVRGVAKGIDIIVGGSRRDCGPFEYGQRVTVMRSGGAREHDLHDWVVIGKHGSQIVVYCATLDGYKMPTERRLRAWQNGDRTIANGDAHRISLSEAQLRQMRIAWQESRR